MFKALLDPISLINTALDIRRWLLSGAAAVAAVMLIADWNLVPIAVYWGQYLLIHGRAEAPLVIRPPALTEGTATPFTLTIGYVLGQPQLTRALAWAAAAFGLAYWHLFKAHEGTVDVLHALVLQPAGFLLFVYALAVAAAAAVRFRLALRAAAAAVGYVLLVAAVGLVRSFDEKRRDSGFRLCALAMAVAVLFYNSETLLIHIQHALKSVIFSITAGVYHVGDLVRLTAGREVPCTYYIQQRLPCVRETI
ncbi:hypothetical protein B0T24DRAFT_589545 [Lasiosphaeria ovina]|uniref:Uncharacterized protein n=1 Tax=Lasiosphaeria ovina TaxID=92902 RepID=A0AAE0KLI3_9PEZI|nr:hypothetical protein B0T24DRAFT_589545 [Lasiosphaeria ovina]